MKRNKNPFTTRKTMSSVSVPMAILAALLYTAPFVAPAATIPLFGTGISTSGTPLAGGAADPHYTVLQTGAPAVVLSSLWGNWGANDAQSQWIGWIDNPFPGNYGTYTFRLTFDLTGYNPATTSLSGGWDADNSGHIELNGQLTGVSQGDDGGVAPTLNPFTLTTGFNAGMNTLDFVCNFPDGYDGLRVGNLVLNVNAVPEPAGLPWLGLVLGALIAFRRRADGDALKPKYA
jgi:hypothetical protein